MTRGLRLSWHHWRKLVAVAEFGSRGSASLLSVGGMRRMVGGSGPAGP
jgi:hypothetical protein